MGDKEKLVIGNNLRFLRKAQGAYPAGTGGKTGD